MAAVDLLTRDDLAELLAEVRRLRADVERLAGARPGDPVSIPEAARQLGVTRRTVQRWIRDGQIQALQVGARRRVVLPAARPAG